MDKHRLHGATQLLSRGASEPQINFLFFSPFFLLWQSGDLRCMASCDPDSFLLFSSCPSSLAQWHNVRKEAEMKERKREAEREGRRTARASALNHNRRWKSEDAERCAGRRPVIVGPIWELHLRDVSYTWGRHSRLLAHKACVGTASEGLRGIYGSTQIQAEAEDGCGKIKIRKINSRRWERK